MLFKPTACALLLVDYQEKLRPAIHDSEQIWHNATVLAQVAQLLHVPAFASEHVPDKLGSTSETILRSVAEHRVFDKHHFGAAHPDADINALALLEEYREGQATEQEAKHTTTRHNQGNARSLPKHLRKQPAPSSQQAGALETVIVAGCETHICLMQTVLQLIDNGWDVAIAVDACGSRKQADKDAALDRMAAAGAELVTVEMLAFEWLASSTHPAFRAVQALFK